MFFSSLFNKKKTFQRVFRLVTDKKNQNKTVSITLIMLKINKNQKTKTQVMRTKTTLIKAVKFVNNCKFIFSFKNNIFQKNIFSVLFCFIILISFEQAGSLNLNLKIESNRNNKISSLDVYSNSNIPNIALIRPFTDSFKSSVTEFSIAYHYGSNNSITT